MTARSRCLPWFGTNGLLKPLRHALGERVHVLTRLRANNALYALPVAAAGRADRPRKYGIRLGSTRDLAAAYPAKPYEVFLYGKCRAVLAYDRIVMLKTLRCAVRVVWVYWGTPFAVTNHLHFCMVATTLVWIYADRIRHTPARRYTTNERTEFAFGDVRRLITGVIAKEGFDSLCLKSPKPQQSSLMATILRLVA